MFLTMGIQQTGQALSAGRARPVDLVESLPYRPKIEDEADIQLLTEYYDIRKLIK